MATLKNVFISHHHKDDASVDGVTKVLSNKEYNVRNSSIRAKPENRVRLEKNQVSDRTIKRLLRMKMQWASKVIVVIGKKTHTRPWVNWEIEMAYKLGKPIIGVYENGLKDDVAVPRNLEKYESSRVAWRAESIIGALEGPSRFEKPDGSEAPNRTGRSIEC